MDTRYHIGFQDEIKAKYAILPGDPGRVQSISEYLEDAKLIGSNREYTTYCGMLDGEDVIIMSTGIGGPSTAIAVEELYGAGVRTFIRVGTCGGMQTEVASGDIVIATAAVRMEGTSKEYVPIEYPAAADYHVVHALVKASQRTQKIHHVGVVQSKDSFYGQHAPQRMPVGYELQNKWEAWIKAGCLASEMECAALFTVAGILRARSGAVLHVVWNQERAKLGLVNDEIHDTNGAIQTAIEAVRILIKQDKQ